jgi:RsiW-degrading membrane proteinase PrsW (M82 family)
MPEKPLEGAVAVRKHYYWWRALLIGFGVYAIGILILVLTQNTIIFPNVMLVGSMLVPVTYVAFFYERRHLSSVKAPATALTFLYGGVLGTLAASLLEPLFIRRLDFQTAFVIGFIEEFVKIWGVLLIARRMRHDSELDGIILGAAAGMGFAALESMGYAFNAFLRSGGSLSATVGVTLLRGLTSPVGHGTWTAIFAAVLFRQSRARRFRLDLKVLAAYLTAVILHGLWDGLPGLISRVVASGLDVLLAQVAVGGVGLAILWLRWREARRIQEGKLEP